MEGTCACGIGLGHPLQHGCVTQPVFKRKVHACECERCAPAGNGWPSSLRRTEKWRRDRLLFQVALLSGRSKFTAGRYTTLAATTSFVFACDISKNEQLIVCLWFSVCTTHWRPELSLLDTPLQHERASQLVKNADETINRNWRTGNHLFKEGKAFTSDSFIWVIEKSSHCGRSLPRCPCLTSPLRVA